MPRVQPLIAMSRRTALTTLIGVSITQKTVTAQTGFHITGSLTATEQESQEGYYQLGSDVAIVVRPTSEPHRILSGLVGHEVQCSVFRV